METWIANLMHDVADLKGWPPQVLIHLSIRELIFWADRGRGCGEMTHDQVMRHWQRQQAARASRGE